MYPIIQKYCFSSVLLILLVVSTPIVSIAQTVKEPTDTPVEWSKPYAPFRIAGNLYYVGTYDLACYLITTPEGNILINTGLANSAKIIEDNIKTLGLKLSDTKILLTTQAHYDHMGAMATLKKRTGAKVMISRKEIMEMENGGSTDYALGNGKATYAPLRADKLLNDKDVISLGGTNLTLLSHPGHTKGSCSYLFTVNDGIKSYKVLIANMPTIVTEKKFGELSSYPTIEADYAYTLKSMKALKFDIWLASHASQFGLHKKRQPKDKYNPEVFMDPDGYQKALLELQTAYQKKMDQNRL